MDLWDKGRRSKATEDKVGQPCSQECTVPGVTGAFINAETKTKALKTKHIPLHVEGRVMDAGTDNKGVAVIF